MRAFTVHTRGSDVPVLVPDAFSWWAFLFTLFWLLAHRAWIAAALAALASLLLALAPPAWDAPGQVALALLLGFCGQDIRRWTLERRGFALASVVAGRDRASALLRLLDARPDLLAAVRA